MKTPVATVGIVFVLILGFLQGCGSTKVHYTGEERYKATRSVEILNRIPKRPYIVIATLEAQAPTYDNGEFLFEKMRNKAQRIGAHAIVPIEYHKIPNYSSVSLQPSYTPPRKPGKVGTSARVFRRQPKSWGKALAIRYLETDKKKDEQEKDEVEESDSNDNPIPCL